MQKILLVDDNPNILLSFKRALHSNKNQWIILTAERGREALEIVSKENVDVILSDLRMPEMDGVELLTRVEAISPSTVRIALTGDADPFLCQRATVVAHQFIAKPVEPKDLVRIVEQVLGVNIFITKVDVKKQILRITNLPSQPGLYNQLITELNHPDVDLNQVAAIVSKDLSMTAKILQLVNSAYFGMAREVTEVSEAIYYLGLETIRDLVFSVQLFSQFDASLIDRAGLSCLWDHSLQVASCSRAIALLMVQDKKKTASYFTAGLLHDIGKLILGTSTPDFYKRMFRAGHIQPDQYIPYEKAEFGSTHADVGAFLLGAWGLPFEIITAVSAHHDYQRINMNLFTPSVSTWFANAYVESCADPKDFGGFQFTPEMLQTELVSKNVEKWIDACRQVLPK